MEPLNTSEFFGADPNFALSFAVFLRQYPQLWRIRRIDRYRPRDLQLADHTVSLQGRIDPSLVERFLDTAALGLEGFDQAQRPKAGDTMTVYLPVTRQPKRLLLDYAIDGADGRSISTLNRYQDSEVEALNILSQALKAGAQVDDHGSFQLTRILSTLVFINPQALAERISEWAKDESRRRRAEGAKLPPVKFGPGTPLTGNDLAQWIEEQGNFFLAGLGTELKHALEEQLPQLLTTKLTIAQTTERVGLDCFLSVPSLLLHGIRDYLKLMYEIAPEWVARADGDEVRLEDEGSATEQDEEPEEPIRLREELLAKPAVFAREVLHALLPGLDLLKSAFSDPESNQSIAMTQALDSWWAYVQIDIALGVPFVVKSSEILPLRAQEPEWAKRLHLNVWPTKPLIRKSEEWFRTFVQTGQFYPINLKDAQSVHVEVELPHPELRMPKPEHIRFAHIRQAVDRARNNRHSRRYERRQMKNGGPPDELADAAGGSDVETMTEVTVVGVAVAVEEKISETKAGLRVVETTVVEAVVEESVDSVPLVGGDAHVDEAANDAQVAERATADNQQAVTGTPPTPGRNGRRTGTRRPRMTGMMVVASPVTEDIAVKRGYSAKEVVLTFRDVFGGVAVPSDRLLHLYSSRQLHEGTSRDFLYSYLSLYVPLRFMRSVVIGYLSLVVAYIVAATFTGVVLSSAMIHHHPPAQLLALVTIAALAPPLSLWMTTSTSPEPLVNKKLVAARRLLEFSVMIIVGFFVAFGVYLLLHHESEGGSSTAHAASASAPVSLSSLLAALEALARWFVLHRR